MGFVKNDITIEERIQIFRQMIDPNRPHGLVTQLHREKGVSRQFLYELRDKGLLALRAAFAPGKPGRRLKTTTIEVNRERVVRAIVTLTADGKVSQRDTQACLAEILEVSPSLGFINGVLAQAEAGAAAFNARFSPRVGSCLVGDELFSQGQPNLLVIEPKSLLILALRREEKRDGTTWGCLLLDLDLDDLEIFASDAAKGIAKGLKESALCKKHQLDLAHLLRDLWYADHQLERKAYKAIAEEYKREEMFLLAKGPKRTANHWQKYVAAKEAADRAIERYDTFHRIALQVQEALEFIDPETGEVRSPDWVKVEIGKALKAMSTFKHWAVKRAASRLRNQLEGLIVYLDHLRQEMAALCQLLGERCLRLLSRIWRYERDLAKKSLAFFERESLMAAYQECLRGAQRELKAGFKKAKDLVGKWLDGVVRGSSLAECINSLLRPHLERRKHTDQGCLDLLMARHNTRRFRQGKRAGHSPLELAGVQLPTDDWLQLIGLPPKSTNCQPISPQF